MVIVAVVFVVIVVSLVIMLMYKRILTARLCLWCGC